MSYWLYTTYVLENTQMNIKKNAESDHVYV